MLADVKKIHIVGVGGIGMSALAKILLQRGLQVSGSDAKGSGTTDALQRQGAKIFIGHAAENVGDVDLVVHSSAIKEGNPEWQAAKRKGIRSLRRAELLAALVKDRKVVAITGAHGKTTTSAMLVSILRAGGKDPEFVLGGIDLATQTNVHLSSNGQSVVVIEADESDGSFLAFSPGMAAITNIDREHMDFYGSMENLQSYFKKFGESVGEQGVLFVNQNDALSVAWLGGYRHKSFAVETTADVWSKTLQTGRPARFVLYQGGRQLAEINLAMGGAHNISNATLAAAIALELGCQAADIKQGLEGYLGVKRRCQWRGTALGAQLFDDYAHHPNEIRAVLAALKGSGRLVALFQPHRYSRFADLYHDFLDAFSACDQVVVLPVYAAGEKPIASLSAGQFARQLSDEKRLAAVYQTSLEAAIKYLRSPQGLRSGDTFVALGAGDVDRANELLMETKTERA